MDRRELTFYIYFGDTFHVLPSHAIDSIWETTEAILKTYLDCGGINVKYFDDESEKICIDSQKEFEEALRLANLSSDKVLVLYIESVIPELMEVSHQTTGKPYPGKPAPATTQQNFHKRMDAPAFPRASAPWAEPASQRSADYEKYPGSVRYYMPEEGYLEPPPRSADYDLISAWMRDRTPDGYLEPESVTPGGQPMRNGGRNASVHTAPDPRLNAGSRLYAVPRKTGTPTDRRVGGAKISTERERRGAESHGRKSETAPDLHYHKHRVHRSQSVGASDPPLRPHRAGRDLVALDETDGAENREDKKSDKLRRPAVDVAVNAGRNVDETEKQPKWFTDFMIKYQKETISKVCKGMSKLMLNSANDPPGQSAGPAAVQTSPSGITPSPGTPPVFYTPTLPTSSQVIHAGVVCDSCNNRIAGIRYKCGNCLNFDLCQQCEALDRVHDKDHVFLKIVRPIPVTKRTGKINKTPLLKYNLYADNDKLDWKKFELKQEKMKQKLEKLEVQRKMFEAQKISVTAAAVPVEETEPEETTELEKESYDANFVRDDTIPDGQHMQPNTKFAKSWVIHNTGTQAWDSNTKLRMQSSDIESLSGSEIILDHTEPDCDAIATVIFLAPDMPGSYSSYWHLMHEGEKFGLELWCVVVVDKPELLDVHETDGSETMNILDREVGNPTSSPLVTEIACDTADEVDGTEQINDLNTDNNTADVLSAENRTQTTEEILLQHGVFDTLRIGDMSVSTTDVPNNTPIEVTPYMSPDMTPKATTPVPPELQEDIHLTDELAGPGSGIFDAEEYSMCSDSDDSHLSDDFCVIPVPDCFLLNKPMTNSVHAMTSSLYLNDERYAEEKQALLRLSRSVSTNTSADSLASQLTNLSLSPMVVVDYPEIGAAASNVGSGVDRTSGVRREAEPGKEPMFRKIEETGDESSDDIFVEASDRITNAAAVTATTTEETHTPGPARGDDLVPGPSEGNEHAPRACDDTGGLTTPVQCQDRHETGPHYPTVEPTMFAPEYDNYTPRPVNDNTYEPRPIDEGRREENRAVCTDQRGAGVEETAKGDPPTAGEDSDKSTQTCSGCVSPLKRATVKTTKSEKAGDAASPPARQDPTPSRLEATATETNAGPVNSPKYQKQYNSQGFGNEFINVASQALSTFFGPATSDHEQGRAVATPVPPHKPSQFKRLPTNEDLLYDMGFKDTALNQRLLEEYKNDVTLVIHKLIYNEEDN